MSELEERKANQLSKSNLVSKLTSDLCRNRGARNISTSTPLSKDISSIRRLVKFSNSLESEIQEKTISMKTIAAQTIKSSDSPVFAPNFQSDNLKELYSHLSKKSEESFLTKFKLIEKAKSALNSITLPPLDTVVPHFYFDDCKDVHISFLLHSPPYSPWYSIIETNFDPKILDLHKQIYKILYDVQKSIETQSYREGGNQKECSAPASNLEDDNYDCIIDIDYDEDFQPNFAIFKKNGNNHNASNSYLYHTNGSLKKAQKSSDLFTAASIKNLRVAELEAQLKDVNDSEKDLLIAELEEGLEDGGNLLGINDTLTSSSHTDSLLTERKLNKKALTIMNRRELHPRGSINQRSINTFSATYLVKNNKT